MAMQITLDGSMRSIGRSGSEKQKWQARIAEIMARVAPNYYSNNDNSINLYSLGASHGHTIGNEKRFYIFNYAGLRPSEMIDVNTDPTTSTRIGEKDIFIANAFTPSTEKEGLVQVKNADGFVIAEYEVARNQLTILFDLTYTYTVERAYVMEYILKEIASYLEEMHLIYSFKYSKNKENLLNGLREQVKQDEEREKRQLEEAVTSYKAEIESFRTRLSQSIRNYDTNSAKLDQIGSYVEKRVATFMDEVNLILGFDKVEDLYMEGLTLVIHTAPLHIRANGSYGGGRTYFGGRYIIKVKPSNTSVRFYAKDNNKQRGYWTGQDPHPHVDGSSGSACLGNASSTIAELCAQNQLYPLTLVLIDFLENANTDDSAGKKVINWPRVMPDGTVAGAGSNDEDDHDGELYCTLNEQWYPECEVGTCNLTGETTHQENLYQYYDEDNNVYFARWSALEEGPFTQDNGWFHDEHPRYNQEEPATEEGDDLF